jgi:hypothetical protein
MTNYPAAIDGASTLYAPADAFSTKPLETTATVATHAESDVTGLVTDLAAKAAKTGDTFTGTLRLAGDQAYLECGPYQTVGGAFENMAKYSEDFTLGRGTRTAAVAR